jgi:uncharacterized protein YkwD
MARGRRTIVLAVALGAALIAVPPPAGANADLGDLLGILSPQEPNQPQPEPPRPSPAPSPPTAPAPPAPADNPIPRESQLLAPESTCPGQSDPGLRPADRSRAMVCMLSHARVAKDRSRLRVYKPLRVSATHKARDIRRCHVLSHEACGRETWYWIEQVGFFRRPSQAGEILAFGGRQKATVLATMRAWLGSRTHRAVILHPGFNLVGVGTVRGRIHRFRATIWVAHLGYLRHRRAAQSRPEAVA